MIRLPLLLFLAAFPLASAPAQTNLLRNGSFEGSLLYWHNVDAEGLVPDDGKPGRHCFRLTHGSLMSAPLVLEKGAAYTISLWAKGEVDGAVLGVGLCPSAREEAVNAGRLWTRGATQAAKLTREWARYSFTWKADVPQSGFWPWPHYMAVISDDNHRKPFRVDGITVTRAAAAPPPAEYLPRAPVEVLTECLNLPGYEGAAANLFERGATARLRAHVSNPGVEPRLVTLRWQLMDFEGTDPVASPVDRSLRLAPGETAAVDADIPLARAGCVLARASVLEGDKTLDRSDLPLTTLPYPKAATRPDPRERFGGSFAGGLGVVKKFQRLGFGWVRWRPHCNGRDHLPEEPADKTRPDTWKWTWFDDILKEQEAHGLSSHLVLYPPPLWIMEKEHGGHPLPKDMRWKADDPRWDDLSVMTVWDHFVDAAVRRYRGYSVVFEIENEPEFDRWEEHKLQGEYAAFTRRTARRIKALAPQARVMVNNVYGIPSSINAALFESPGGLRDIDILSWHDYHGGGLGDQKLLRRFRQNLDEAGGAHVEIWFNEGWAYTNTAVDEPPACQGTTSAGNTIAIAASVAELSAAGQKKTVLFHTAYEKHGMSFWDYSGPGTMLWDWYNLPLPLVGMWNVLTHHIGVSDEVGLVRLPGCSAAVFQDLRNRRGVAVFYADPGARADAGMDLPPALRGARAEDIMGNPVALDGDRLRVPKSGRLVYLYRDETLSGADLLAALAPLDRKHQSFVSAAPGAAARCTLPASWDGAAKGASDGNPLLAGGRPVWRLDALLPKADPILPGSYEPMVWDGVEWKGRVGGQGGQPGAAVANGELKLGIRGPWNGPGVEHIKTAALAFTPPAPGRWRLTATVSAKKWEGGAATALFQVAKRDAQRVARLREWELPLDGAPQAVELEADLAEGHTLVLLPILPHYNNGALVRITDLRVTAEP